MRRFVCYQYRRYDAEEEARRRREERAWKAEEREKTGKKDRELVNA